MIAEQPKLIRRAFCSYLLLVLAIQSIHRMMDMLVYDMIYVLIITLILTMGELTTQYRVICFGVGFFLMDVWPDWFLMLIAIFSFALRKIKPITTLNLKKLRKSHPKFTAKIGI